ncbi:MAG: hypothetical protein JW976_02585 [Syntrophaceae bacterium]|nr:hypothetical protein [Syntrophaceae bacterium]
MKKSVVLKEKNSSMIIMIVTLFIITLIGACATEPVNKVWSKPNATQNQFTKDRYDCMKQAQPTISKAKGTNSSAELRHVEDEALINVEIYNLCMEARGWSLKEVKSISENSNNREILTFADGTKYEGNIVNGQPHGRGTYTWANGNKYEGDWADGKMSGMGTYTCSNGKQFTGDFENNKPVGFTINCVLQNSGNISIPRRTMSEYQRQGSYTDANGNKYEGNIVNGKLHGKGTLTSPSGNKYEGDFVDGKINGWGTYTCSNGKQFTGNFKNNKPVGFTVKCN